MVLFALLSFAAVRLSLLRFLLSLVRASFPCPVLLLFSPPPPSRLLFPRAAVDTLRLSVTSLLINVVARRSERFIPS